MSFLCDCLPDHAGWDGGVVWTAQNVSDEHLIAAFADPQVENLQTRKEKKGNPVSTGAAVPSAEFCRVLLDAYAATVHEEGAISAQPLGRQVEQMRLGYHGVVQV